MNKSMIFSLILLGCLNWSHAQQLAPYSATQHKLAVHQILQSNVKPGKHGQMNTRALSYRVIGQSTYDNVLSAYTDSVNLSYGLNGTSQYDFSMLLYAYNYPYSTSPMFNNYLGIFTNPQVLQKTYNHWTVNPNTLVYGFYEKRNSTYDGGYNLVSDTSWLADSLINPNTINENTFNVLNQVTASYKSNYVGGLVDSAFKQFYEYNGSDQLIKDSTYEYDGSAWHLVSKTFYTYDVAGNLTLINNYSNNSDPTFLLPLVNLIKYVNTYDGSNRLLTVQCDYFDGTALNPYVKDTFAYTGISNFHTNWKEYQYDPINAMWAPQLNMTKYLNGSGMPDSIMIDQYNFITDTWTPNYKYILTYDANDNPKTLDQYIFNFVSFPTSPDFTTTYYYESFTNTTGVAGAQAQSGDFVFYPNPASESLHIMSNQNTSMSVLQLFNATGENMGIYPLHSGVNTIDISGYSSGFYIGQIIAGGEVLQAQKVIVK